MYVKVLNFVTSVFYVQNEKPFLQISKLKFRLAKLFSKIIQIHE